MAKTKKTKAKQKPIAEMAPQRPPQYNAAAKRWLWIWVSFFTIMIVVLWGWATKISLSSFSWSKTPEKQIIDSRQDDWDILFNNERDRIKNERIKIQLKNVLNKIVTEATTTTTPTTTISATTTPIINSSTTSTP